MQSIIAEKRDILGKKTAALRSCGVLPAVLYGSKTGSQNISVSEKDFMKLWKTAGESSIIDLKVSEKNYNVLIHDVAKDPLKDKPLHVDFLAVDMGKKLNVDVPLEFIGESEGVKAGGVLVKVLHELKIEAMPKFLPQKLVVDLEPLKVIGGSLAIKDIKLPAGVKVLDNLEDTVVLVEAQRTEEEIKGEEAAAPSLENIEVVTKKPKVEEAGEGAESASEKSPGAAKKEKA